MARLIATSQQEEKQNNNGTQALLKSIRQNQLCIYTTNKAIPKPREGDADMALLKVMDGSASAKTVGYLYEPLPVEKFK